MFTSALGYVALRLLGVARDDRDATRLREWIEASGGVVGAASWGKFVLALLNLYDYDGLHPVLPELWLLPEALPIHPSRLWCHCRQVYLPMAWLYGRRAHGPEDALVHELRADLYRPRRYDAIRFRDERDTLCPGDRHLPRSAALDLAQRAMGLYERVQGGAPLLRDLRGRALELLREHIEYEDRVTGYVRLGPVNAVLNTLVHLFRARAGEAGATAALEQGFAQLDGYLWHGHDGLKMNGYSSCASWDTAFAVQAILATPSRGRHRGALERAHGFLRDSQITEDPPERRRHHRDPSRGGWAFSDRVSGWPVSDCTAEGLIAALALEQSVARPVAEELLAAAVELILDSQNDDGGWATYERRRGPAWLERLNPSQVFSDIMVDYSYVECTSSCIQALVGAQRRFPGRFDRRIAAAVRRGERFIRGRQRVDGSWEGSWGVCFTYGTWFAVSALRAAGAPASDPALERACSFLQAHQDSDGGWGEHGASCTERRYIPLARGHSVNTAWALLALQGAGQAGSDAARRGARFLVDLQQPDGDWPRQPLCGVFNKTVLINYENYRRYFPVWALARQLELGGYRS
jgi:squalene/oxidosqualene cyclase-like protein